MKDKPKKTPRSGRKTAAEAASRAGKSAKHGRATAQPAPQEGKAMPKAGTAAHKPRTVRLGQFREDPDNVSVATDEEIARLAGKLKRVPLGLTAMRIAYVTDAPGGGCMVVSGNKRLRCLKAAYGEDGEVPAEWFQDITAMSESERHEFRLNANISDGHFDLDKLLAQYDTAELSEAGLDELLADIGEYEKQEVDLSGGEIKNSNLDQISIIIRFENEDAAQGLFERLTKEGYKCELSTL